MTKTHTYSTTLRFKDSDSPTLELLKQLFNHDPRPAHEKLNRGHVGLKTGDTIEFYLKREVDQMIWETRDYV